MPNTIISTDDADFKADMARLYELLTLADAGVGQYDTGWPPRIMAWPFDQAAIMIADWARQRATA
jgi:hypothetical protein